MVSCSIHSSVLVVCTYNAVANRSTAFFNVNKVEDLTVTKLFSIGYNHLNNVTRLADEKDNEGLDGFYVEATYDWNFLDKGWGSLGLQPGLRYTFAGESDSEEVLGVVTR